MQNLTQQQKTKLKLILIYFLYSAFIVILWTIFDRNPSFDRQFSDTSSLSSLQWYDYAKIYLTFLSVPAFYGLLSPFVMLRVRQGAKSGNTYLLVACLVGVLTTVAFLLTGSLNRGTCGESCPADILPYSSNTIIALATIPPLWILPGYILRKINILDSQQSKRSATSAS